MDEKQGNPMAGLTDPFVASQKFKDPAFLRGVAEAALKHDQPNALKWLEQAHTAAKEGAFEAIGHLMSDNPQEAVNVWNRTGQFRDVTGVNKNKDGTYTISRQNGATMTLDPIKEYKRMLSPREFMAYEQQQAEAKDRAERYKLDDRRYQERAAADKDWRATQERHWQAQLAAQEGNAALQHARWAAGGGGGGTRSSGSGGGGSGGDYETPPLKPKEVLDAYEKSREEAAKRAEATPGEPVDVDAIAADSLAQKTATLKRNARTGQWGIRIALPSGLYGTLAEFDSEAEAAAAIQQLVRSRKVPAQNRLARDDRRDAAPGEGGGAYQTPTTAAPRAARAPAAQVRRLPMLTPEEQAAVVSNPALQAELARRRAEEERRAAEYSGGGVIPMGK